SFDSPGLYDRLQRATAAATTRPLQMCQSLITVVGALVTSVVILVSLIAIQPFLVPLMAVSLIPAALTAAGLAATNYGFAFRTTAMERERAYVRELLTTT